MKTTGIVRKIDSLGRIVLPIEIRRALDIEVKDPVEIFVSDEHIILGEYHTSCLLCDEHGSTLKEYKGKHICTECIEKLINRV